MKPKKVLVAGASGYLGKNVVIELKKRGYFVRALIRKEKRKELFSGIPVDEFFIAQITKPESLQGVANGIDWVFSSIGITKQKENLAYFDVDYKGNLNLLREAEKTSVERFEYIAICCPEKMRETKIIEAKERSVNVLKSSKIASTVIRPTGFFTDIREFLEMASKGKIFLLGSGENKINPISGEDLAKVCIDSFENNVDEVSVGGPIVYTHEEIARMAFDILGKRTNIFHLPIWLKDLALPIIKIFVSSNTYGQIEFFLKAMSNDMVAPQYGTDLLEDYFEREAENYLRIVAKNKFI